MKSGLFTRLAWGFGLALILLHVGSYSFHAHDALVQQAADFTLAQIDRVQLIGELTDADPPLLERISSDAFRIQRQNNAPKPPRDERWRHQAEIHDLIAPKLPALGIEESQLRYWFVFGRNGPRLELAMQQGAAVSDRAGAALSAASWLRASIRAEPARWRPRLFGLIWTTAFALMILGIVLWATRRFTRFLPQLALAAEQIGTFGDTRPLPLTGPKEVRKVSAAFNRMQERLRQHERERGTMLGAFSHDIRTLITRITLRLERLEAGEELAKIEADLASVTQIVDEALAYSQDEVSDEPRTRLDLGSLLQSLVDDTPGAVVAEAPSEPVTLVAQQHGLRRALLNVISNAVLYGLQASVSWRVAGDEVVITIADQGPGIPADDQKRVLEPYVRLEKSRNRKTGGSGLGLAIANNVVRRHNGNLSFHQSATGFQVRIAIPLAAE